MPTSLAGVKSISERAQGSSVRQDVQLDAPGGSPGNHLAIVVHNGPVNRDQLAPSEAGIRRELASHFPGMVMRVVQTPRSNALGVYGLAVGSTPKGLRCIYAWQWLDRTQASVMARFGGDASWRGRLCREGQTLDEMAAGFDQISFEPGGRVVAQPPSATRPKLAVVRSGSRVSHRPLRREAVSAQAAMIPTGSTVPARGRFLAPVSASDSTQVIGSDDTDAQGVRSKIDPTLPPRAYMGPATQNILAMRAVPTPASSAPPAVESVTVLPVHQTTRPVVPAPF